jgi:hypothetical protein
MIIKKKNRLSVAMIVRNEEATISRALRSVSPIAMEMIVLDTGSTDATKSIALSEGAFVYDYTWTDDFSSARNASLEHASGEWILVLDADEWLEPSAANKIEALIHGPTDRAFYLIQKNIDSSGTILRNSMARLFPNHRGIRYCHRVHEDAIPSIVKAGLPIIHSGIEFSHSGYMDSQRVSQKVARNKAIIESSLVAPGISEAHMRFNLGVILVGEGDFVAAASQFEWCMAHAESNDLIVKMSRLRCSECYYQKREYEKALELLPKVPTADTHPVALFLAACILHKQDPQATLPWLECLLAAPDMAWVPPTPTPSIKTAALPLLGRYWLNAGQPEITRQILVLASQIKSGAIDASTPELINRYRDIVSTQQSN